MVFKWSTTLSTIIILVIDSIRYTFLPIRTDPSQQYSLSNILGGVARVPEKSLLYTCRLRHSVIMTNDSPASSIIQMPRTSKTGSAEGGASGR